MTARRHPSIVNLAELEPGDMFPGTKFASRARRLTTAVASRAIGCSWFEVQPGNAAFPFHWHASNEEAIYVLDGEGTLRLGDERYPVRAGDYVALLTGPEHAHQLINTGAAPLRYLVISTMHPVEVAGYPDSKKIGAVASKDGRVYLRQVHREDNQKGYFDGEDT
jgi:uncharacterized cupin superfamily protein